MALISADQDDPTPALHPFTASLRSDEYAFDLHEAHSPPPPASETPRQPSQSRGFFCRLPFVMTLIILLSLLSIVAASIGFGYLLISPKNPKLSISTIMVTHPWAKHPRVLISVKANNPNDKVGLFYDNGGRAALSFRNKSVATGPFPTFYLEKKGSLTVGLVLKAANKTMPRRVRNSILNGTDELRPLPLNLTMNVPVRMKVWTTKIWIDHLVFDCTFRVNTLSNTSRILRQKCPLKVPPRRSR